MCMCCVRVYLSTWILSKMWKNILICCLLFPVFEISNANREVLITVGGFFEEGYEYLEWIFRYVVEEINVDKVNFPNINLQVKIETAKKQDTLFFRRKVCEWIKSDVVAIFGPQTLHSTLAVQSIAESTGIPLIINRWEYKSNKSDTTLFMHPHADTNGEAYRDFFKSRKWDKFVILYDDPKALIRLNSILTDIEFQKGETKRVIVVKQVEDRAQYKKIFKDMKKINARNFLIDIPTQDVQFVLNQAVEMEMVGIYYNYFFTSLDVHTVDLTPFQPRHCNITMYRVIDTENYKYKLIAERLNLTNEYPIQPYLYKTQFALMYDAVYHFAKSLSALDSYQLHKNLRYKPKSCALQPTWSYGKEIADSMKNTTSYGLTGEIMLNENGYRTNFSLTELRLVYTGLNVEGHWNGPGNFTPIVNETAAIQESTDIISGRQLRICSVVGKPYFMEAENHTEENPHFIGYAIELIDKLAKFANFSYVFYKSPNNKHGDKKTGEWNGMIGELIKHKADIAIGDLTVNEERSSAVDFTLPFMHLGISILFKKPEKKAANLFSFLSPFSMQVWFYVATGVLGVTIVMYIMGRFTPYEWTNPHPCDKEPAELENQFILKETVWLVIGCLMQQGGDIEPKATSTRMAIGYWWFFTMIMVSSYTANLAAFLTAGRMEVDIKSAEDLANQQKIQYGCLKDGTTQGFFKKSSDPLHSKMWTVMESAEPSVFVEQNEDGQKRVKMGNYAYFMESTSIEYAISTDCELVQVGEKLDRKSYAIATVQGSPLREKLSQGILKLSENGEIEILKKKWWRKDKCPPEAPSSDTLGLENIGGVFLILIIGLPIACFTVVMEFYWENKKIPRDQRGPICLELYKELKLTCMGKNTTKAAPPEEEDEEKIISSKKANNLSASRSSSSTETRP